MVFRRIYWRSLVLQEQNIFLNGGDGHSIEWETDLFEEKLENYGIITIKAQRFGLFTRIESQGTRLKSTTNKKCLLGRDIPDNLKPSMTLTGHVGGLILHEGSSVNGNIVLHHGDVYRERRGRPPAEYRKKLIIRESPKLPFDSLLIPELIYNLDSDLVMFLASKNAINGSKTMGNQNDPFFK